MREGKNEWERDTGKECVRDIGSFYHCFSLHHISSSLFHLLLNVSSDYCRGSSIFSCICIRKCSQFLFLLQCLAASLYTKFKVCQQPSKHTSLLHRTVTNNLKSLRLTWWTLKDHSQATWITTLLYYDTMRQENSRNEYVIVTVHASYCTSLTSSTSLTSDRASI